MDKNTTVVFPAPLMTTIAELGSFLAREKAAASPAPLTTAGPVLPPIATANGTNGRRLARSPASAWPALADRRVAARAAQIAADRACQ